MQAVFEMCGPSPTIVRTFAAATLCARRIELISWFFHTLVNTNWVVRAKVKLQRILANDFDIGMSFKCGISKQNLKSAF